MLEKARALEPAPGLSFEQRRIEDALGGERFGLVFSNAALHWVDDHPALLLFHDTQDMLCHERVTAEIHADHPVPG